MGHLEGMASLLWWHGCLLAATADGGSQGQADYGWSSCYLQAPRQPDACT